MEIDPQIQSLVTLVRNEHQKVTRGPYGSKQALEDARRLNEHSLERIVLERGERVWRAYYSAKKAAGQKRYFSGQAQLAKEFEAFHEAPYDKKHAFAEQLALVMTGLEPSLGESNSDEAEPRARAKRRCTRPDRPERIDASGRRTSSTTPVETPEHLSNTGHLIPEAVAPTTTLSTSLRIGAPLEPAKDLFHELFWDSVERIQSPQDSDTWLADVTIFLQQGSTREHFGCQMEIGITPEKVTEYALKYFRVQVEVKDGVRYIGSPLGALIEPDPSMKFRQCARDFSDIFKGELYDAACDSPVYQTEKAKRLSFTNGVSMTISNQPQECGKMTVYMGEWKAVQIHERLYG